MRTRHRMPMIFSLSMMDVFCCTLGCVILLWLINQREAMLRTRAAHAALQKVDETSASLGVMTGERDSIQRQLSSSQADLAAARQQISDARADLSAVQKQMTDTRADLATARARSDTLAKQLVAVRTQAADTEDRLSKKTLAEQQLTRQQAEALQRIANLEQSVQEKELSAGELAKRIAEMMERLAAADNRITLLRKQADLLPEVRDAAAASDAKAKAFERDLLDARRALDAAQGESREVAGRLARVQAAAQQRFEGIALTGKRVIFLVDMSGSMDLVDDRTPDANKWPGVRDTLLRIMRSLPQLEQYQVLLFSDRVMYLIGNENRWLDYNANSADRVGEALTAIRPKGNTNMYAALESAFQFRQRGLDTIYFLSDGLPNIGEGLTQTQAAALSDMQRSDALSRAVRNALKSNWNRSIPGQPKVRINTVGFFYESPEVGAFLWALARENDGSFVGMSKP